MDNKELGNMAVCMYLFTPTWSVAMALVGCMHREARPRKLQLRDSV